MKESRGITPLRTILQNCLNHIENLETNRSICDNYDKEFQDLKQFSETLKVQKEYSCTEGEKEVNRKKNRYKDILPFNVSRVILSEYAGIPGSDYINANYIKGASGSPAYIASQGPLPNTVNDFWRMVVECEVQVIVMACNAQESGKHKCENYWVEKEGEEKRFGMVQICLVKASTVCPDFLVRTMRLKYTNVKDVTEERTVCQFHYSAWPDHGVPPLVRPLLDMVRLVRDTQASETLPVLVHCSAGCGRTGTICAIDFVWGLLRAGKLTEEFSLFNLVKDMRKQRVAMVQTKEQYILVHQAVRELFKEQLRVIESHPYENIDFNGVPLIKDFEEPLYDTICIQKEENCDEKQDKSEMKEKSDDGDSRLPKSDLAPPLPRKKRPNVLFSKQEKEAENLTEKNRSSFAEKEKEREKERPEGSPSSLLGKPRIAKLRALFEKSPTTKERASLKDRGSQTVSRSHSLGAIRKPLTAEVFDSQIERSKPVHAPQQSASEAVKLKHSKSFSKSMPLIKRSKSLKTFSQSSNLCVSAPSTVERKTVTVYSSKPREVEILRETRQPISRKKSACDAPQALELPKDSIRRRSLESLMGDLPPSITWPTAVMGSERDRQSSKGNKKSTEWSPKLNSYTIQGSKTADMLKLQLQRLSLETEKKMNTFVSGIGIRERRNSFRQAVTKSELQNIFRDYREQHNPGAKKQLGSENVFRRHSLHSKKVTSDVMQSTDQPDGVIYVERDGPVDVKLNKKVLDVKRYKTTQDKPSILVEAATQAKKVSQRHPAQQNPLASTSGQMILDQRNRRVIQSKSARTYEDIERNGDSKNLFLKKLNSEMFADREGMSGSTSQSNEMRSRSSYEDSDKFAASRYPSAPMLVRSDSKKNFFKTNLEVKSTGSYSISSDSFDELDRLNGRFERAVDVESSDKIFHPSNWQSSNFQAHQPYPKTQNLKRYDCSKCYTSAQATQSALHRTNPSHKPAAFQNSVGENSRRSEIPQEVRHKEPFFNVSHKKNVCYVVPPKAHSSNENEVGGFSGYRREHGVTNSDLYVVVKPEFDSNDKKSVLPLKMTAIDKNSKTAECLPWPQSAPSRSSGELSSSDQQSTKSDSSRTLGQYESENSSRPDVKMLKKSEQSKGVSKIRVNESGKMIQNVEPSGGPSKQMRPEELKPKSSVEFSNYGVMATNKVRPNTSNYSKDDFLLGEPTAPPRVKRHASVTVPRNNLNGSNHVTAWVSSENKVISDRNTNFQVEKSAWSGTLGVDLDAVAASMQQDKREPAAGKDVVWPNVNNLGTSSSSNGKKKQHYF